MPDDVSERLRAAFADLYDIERELGHGGMATVYLARDRKHDRLIALKVLRPDLVSTLGASRFLREIAIAAYPVWPRTDRDDPSRLRSRHFHPRSRSLHR
jgi:serine/threonine protein kinase